MALTVFDGRMSIDSAASPSTIPPAEASNPGFLPPGCSFSGTGNLAASFFGGFCATGALARTVTNIRAGARSPVSAVIHAVFLLAAAVFGSDLIARLPMAGLAALLLMTAWRLLDVRWFARLLRLSSRHDAAVMAAFYAPEIVMVTPEYCTPRQGIEAASQTHTVLFTEFPQLQDEVVEIVADEDTVAVQFIAHSTTPGREFDLPIVAIFQIRDGLIVHDQTYYDNRGQACTP